MLLNRAQPDRVPWFGDLDYWYSSAVPPESCPRDTRVMGIFNSIAIWASDFICKVFSHLPSKSRYNFSRNPRREYHHPGDEHAAGRSDRNPAVPAHLFFHRLRQTFVESPADLPIFQYYLESLEFTPAYAEAERRYHIIGDNGVVLCYTPRSPFMQMATTYVGIVNLVYLLADAPDEMARIFKIMEAKYDQAAELTVNSPAECVMIPENLSSEVVGAGYYKRYLRPYEARWIQRIREAGKFSFIHMDGTLKGLINLVVETGFNVIEAVTPYPSGDLTIEEIAAG